MDDDDPEHRHAVADQARDLRDAREPELQQPVREVPRRPAGPTVGVENGAEKPLIRCPEWLPGDIPHDLAAHRICVNGGDDGRLRHRDLRLDVRLHDLRRGPDPQLLALGARVLASRRTSSRRRRARATRTTTTSSPAPRAGSPTTRRTSGPAQEDGKSFKSWGCDAYGDDVFVFVTDDAGNLTKHDTCFEFPTVGEQLTDAGVDWAYYSAVPGSPATSGTPTTASRTCSTRTCGTSTSARSTRSSTTSTRTPCRR